MKTFYRRMHDALQDGAITPNQWRIICRDIPRDALCNNTNDFSKWTYSKTFEWGFVWSMAPKKLWNEVDTEYWKRLHEQLKTAEHIKLVTH